MQWLSDKNLFIINGLSWNGTKYDSKYTCYRGRYQSHNDLLMTNKVDMISAFNIIKKEYRDLQK